MPYNGNNGLTLNDTVRDYLKVLGFPIHTTEGDVGLELEAEGTLSSISTTWWRTENDGSLRNNGKEYIFKKPLPLATVPAALTQFEDLTTAFVFNKSPRTSCHVHYNAQTWTFKELYSIVGAYWLFEDLLFELCGPSRVGNLFCLRASDAQKIVNAVISSVKDTLTSYNTHFVMQFGVDGYKYGALNLSCLSKYGSLEFRGMRGIYTKAEILPWVNMLWSMIQRARAAGSPVAVYTMFKELPLNILVQEFFGEHADKIMAIPHWQDALKQSSHYLAQLAHVINQADQGKYTRPPLNTLKPRPKAVVYDDALPLDTIVTGGGGGTFVNNSTPPAWGINTLFKSSKTLLDDEMPNTVEGDVGTTAPPPLLTYPNILVAF